MKKFLFILLIILSIGFISCEKEIIEIPQTPVEVSNEVSIFGEWLLVDGQMFITNTETNEKIVMNHFSDERTVSSLNYSGIKFDIERIEKGVTTWKFLEPPTIPGTGSFILNGNNEKPLGFHMTKNNWTIVEHPLADTPEEMGLGGSGRPFNAYVVSGDTIIIQIQEMVGSINGYNCVYFSELTFVKIG